MFLDGQVDGEESIFNKGKYLSACQELPFLISEQCCGRMKKSPMHHYETITKKVSIVGTLAEESMLRKQGWLRTGCNAFEKGKSQPLSFWTEQDILQYIRQNNLKIASVYGDIVFIDNDGSEFYDSLIPDDCKLKCTGCQRTGCMYCAFGAGNEAKRLGKSRYEILGELHPQVYDYVLRGGKWIDNPYYDKKAPEYDGEWKNYNPKKIWIPSDNGLGMKFVFDEVNKLYGKDFIKY